MSTLQFRRDIQEFLTFPAKMPAGARSNSVSALLAGDHSHRNSHAIEELTDMMDVIARHHQEALAKTAPFMRDHTVSWQERVHQTQPSSNVQICGPSDFTGLNAQLHRSIDAYQVLGSSNSLGAAEEIRYMREIKKLPAVLNHVAQNFESVARNCAEDDPTRNELNASAMYARVLRRSVTAQMREMEGPGRAIGETSPHQSRALN